MKSAGKARSNGLYRHIRTSKEIIRNLLNDQNKNKIKEYLEPIFLFIICIISIVVVYYVEFSQNVKVLEQKAYYVEKQLVLENPEKISEYQEFQIAIGRVENELLYVEDKVFYNAFSIKLEW